VDINKGKDGVDWIKMTENRDKWRVVVRTVMKLRVPLMQGILNQLRNYYLIKKDLLHGISNVYEVTRSWVDRMETTRKAYRILVGKHLG
jgi:hypothetical protein